MVHPPIASGAPGAVVTMEWRATVRRPTEYFAFEFSLAPAVAEFVGAEIEGTASEHGSPQGVIYDPAFFRGGYRIGMRFDTTGDYEWIEPGEDLLLIKARFRVLADATVGEHVVRITKAEFVGLEPLGGGRFRTFGMTHTVEGNGGFTVLPPDGPRPVGDLACAQDLDEVLLSWSVTESYDAIDVLRDGDLLVTLPADASSHADRPDPGPAEYAVVARRDGAASLPVACDLLVQEPLPPSPEDFQCASTATGIELGWVNPAAYDAITVLRNDRIIAELEGSATSFNDSFISDLFTVYTLIARAEGLAAVPVSCHLNEGSETFVYWAEEARCEPGAIGVPIRIFGTHPETVSGMDLSLRIDPTQARIRELTIEGTASQAYLADFFLYQDHVLDTGETRAGIGFDHTPPFGNYLPPGADQHVLTVIVDILPEASPAIAVDLDGFGSPPGACGYGVRRGNGSVWIPAESRDGWILVGKSPVPEVNDARAEPMEVAGSPGAKDEVRGIRLGWQNASAYSSIRIERDGQPLEDLPGDATGFVDPEPGPGVHRYRIVARQGDIESFPTVVTNQPEGVPGTFLRGDANSDRVVNITDAIFVLNHLFRAGSQPTCLDAADADDNGAVALTDAIVLLHHLFLSRADLPLPGTRSAWFDPTPDALPCR